MTELALTPMTPADLDEVLGIERVSYPEPWPREVFARELSGEDGSVALVARAADGRVAGYIVYRFGVGEVELHNVAVHPEARSQGVGRALVERLVADARARSAERVLLEVRVGNAPARALYTRLGFETLATRRRYYRDNDEDALVLEKKL